MDASTPTRWDTLFDCGRKRYQLWLCLCLHGKAPHETPRQGMNHLNTNLRFTKCALGRVKVVLLVSLKQNARFLLAVPFYFILFLFKRLIETIDTPSHIHILRTYLSRAVCFKIRANVIFPSMNRQMWMRKKAKKTFQPWQPRSL